MSTIELQVNKNSNFLTIQLSYNTCSLTESILSDSFIKLQLKLLTLHILLERFAMFGDCVTLINCLIKSLIIIFILFNCWWSQTRVQ